jgi:tryptophanyl-tRNA synthetase
VETSQAERHAGINVSYENSFNAIKKDIAKETVDKKIRQAVLTKEVIPIEEKPNKPKDKMIVKGMQGGNDNSTYVSQRSGGAGVGGLMIK